MARVKGSKKSEYDVRVVTYDTTNSKRDIGVIRFHEGLWQLIGDKKSYVGLMKSVKHPNRLYFVPWDKADESTKQRCIDGYVMLNNSKLQFYKENIIKICKEFTGEYQLQFDDMGERLYYINKDKVNQPTYYNGNCKVPHNSYSRNKTVEIPKQRPIPTTKIEIKKKIADVTDTSHTEKNSVVDKDDKKVILELLDVLDTYDTNDMVFKAGHTFIQAIRGLVK